MFGFHLKIFLNMQKLLGSLKMIKCNIATVNDKQGERFYSLQGPNTFDPMDFSRDICSGNKTSRQRLFTINLNSFKPKAAYSIVMGLYDTFVCSKWCGSLLIWQSVYLNLFLLRQINHCSLSTHIVLYLFVTSLFLYSDLTNYGAVTSLY